MNRVLVLIWRPELSDAQRKALAIPGAKTEILLRPDPPRIRELATPDAFVIDLGRAPSQGRDLAVWLRRQKATRHVPLVFLAGDPEKTERVRELLPDAAYTTWETLHDTVDDAIRRPPGDPVVPGALDAYAGTPLVKKLGIRAGAVVALIDAPDGFASLLAPLPEDVIIRSDLAREANVLLLFSTCLAALEARFHEAARALAPGGRLWLAWPKRASGARSDLSQPVVRRFGLDREFVDYKIGSLDATWSALCFARREGAPANDRESP